MALASRTLDAKPLLGGEQALNQAHEPLSY